MMCVKTVVRESRIHGLGVFALEFIPAGTVVWRFTPGFDLRFTKEQLAAFPKEIRDYLKVYGWLSKKSNMFVFAVDNAKYVNHSETPNTLSAYYEAEEEAVSKAVRDIQAGEEITDNYDSFTSGYLTWWRELKRKFPALANAVSVRT